jgi:hypothetical protein
MKNKTVQFSRPQSYCSDLHARHHPQANPYHQRRLTRRSQLPHHYSHLPCYTFSTTNTPHISSLACSLLPPAPTKLPRTSPHIRRTVRQLQQRSTLFSCTLDTKHSSSRAGIGNKTFTFPLCSAAALVPRDRSAIEELCGLHNV